MIPLVSLARIRVVLASLIWIAVDLASSPEIFPVTVAGWVSLFLGLAACAALFLTWGRGLAKLDAMRAELASVATKVDRLDPNLGAKVEHIDDSVEILRIGFTKMEHTLWGPDGKNGALSVMRESRARIEAIEARNRVIDAIEERARGAERVGHENRERSRRAEDRALRGEEDE